MRITTLIFQVLSLQLEPKTFKKACLCTSTFRPSLSLCFRTDCWISISIVQFHQWKSMMSLSFNKGFLRFRVVWNNMKNKRPIMIPSLTNRNRPMVSSRMFHITVCVLMSQQNILESKFLKLLKILSCSLNMAISLKE